ncbi:MAG: hypothetical protein HY000_22860 [Planctomycetes bacterium]|nr:hypothetical protein [Planctomycetota bacterium]
MGLLNYVRCRYPLPDAEAQGLMFQTKSMPDLRMATYEVTPDGMLLLFKDPWDRAGEPESSSSLGALHFVAGKPFPVRGELEIHTSAERADGRSCWYSYRLLFRDGRVIDVQRGADCGQILPLPESESEP